MKKFFLALSFLLTAALGWGQNTVSVTADLKNIFSTAQASKVQVCFSLVDGNGQQINNPRVLNTGVVVNTTNVCQSPDANGHFAATMLANDKISPTGSLYQVIYNYNGSPVHGDTYQFLVTDTTEDLNTKTPVTASPLITPPTGDTTYARLDTGNQPFTGPIKSCAVNGTLVVGSFCYSTLQAAITAACSVSPISPIYAPSGTFPAPNLSGFTGLCNGLQIQGAGKAQGDSVTCPTTVTTNQTSGILFDETNVNDILLANFCIKNIGSAGTAIAIKRSATQRSINQNLYISGPFLNPLLWQSSSSSLASTIWNFDINIHTTGTAAGGTGCSFNAQDAVSKVVNNNYLYNVVCTGGAGGFGLRTQSTTANPVINELEIHSGELVSTSGSAVTIGANTVRDFKCQNCNIEGSSTGATIAVGNTGEFDSSNISANGDNSLGANVSDSSGVGGFFWPGSNHIGGQAPSPFRATVGGDVSVNSLSFGAAGSNGNNTWNFTDGTQIWSSGSFIIDFEHLIGVQFNKSLVPFTAGGSNLGSVSQPFGDLFIGVSANHSLDFNTSSLSTNRQATWPDNAGTVAETNLTQNWSGIQHLSSNYVFVASDFTTANNTNQQTITGLTWTLPATAANYGFHCNIQYSQATGAVADQFGIQAATNAPTNIMASGEVWTGATATTAGSIQTLTTTTATPFVTFTPSGTATVFNALLDGTIELGASLNTINITVQTSNGADAITIKRGSGCQLF